MDRAFSTCLLSVVVCTAWMLTAVTSAAPDEQSPSSDDPVMRKLERMQQQIESLQSENQSMRGELNELRAKTGENWLTEQRAREIRGIVTDVLADADTRAGYLQSGLIAGWDDGFFMASTDDRFRLEMDGLVQVRFLYNYIDDNRTFAADRHRWGFENTRTKLTFRGHVYGRDTTYLVRGDFARNNTGDSPSDPAETRGGFFKLQDAWVRQQFNEYWSLRAGQFKLPFNREELVSPAHQLAVERSVVNEILNVGRSQGIELAYQDDVNRFNFAISDGAEGNVGGGNIVFTNPPNTGALVVDTDWAFTARYERLIAGTWQQFEDFTSPYDEPFGLLIGISGHAQEEEAVNAFGGDVLTEYYAATVDISAEWGGANAFVAFHNAYVDTGATDPFKQYGLVLQGGMKITPKWEAFARYEHGWWDNSASVSFADLSILTLGAVYYMDGHDLKWTTDFGIAFNEIEGVGSQNLTVWASDLAGYRFQAAGTRPQLVFRTQFQLRF